MTYARIGMAIGGLILIVLLFTVGPSMCTSMFSAKQEARLRKGQAEASIDSGAEASNTIANLMEGDTRTKAVVAEGLEAIRNAPEAEKDDEAHRALCRLKLYAATPRCQPVRSN